MNDGFWVKFAATFLAVFLLGGIMTDNLEKMPTETEKCTERMMELIPAAMPQYANATSEKAQAALEIRAISICTGHPN
ncbi:hypothetical protein [Phaeobacter italicus]|uniref:hypothetical protein n=1 Tax=Phaeobacter italicus TaxID=481446 RepID=UPI001C98AFD7|nr:hypothetical protein [Phaeobacter italicus]MBY6043619.1 hypothetical protein [Phaeobacter italicus]